MKSIKPTQAYIDETRAGKLLKKWSKVLDYSSDKVAPLTESTRRLNTAMLLENQENWCLTEANTYSGGVYGANAAAGLGTNSANQFSADTYATGDARLPKVLIPMIRRTFPELITNEIVGVQPMGGPVGLAFALRYKYESDALGTDTARNPYTATPSDGKEMGWNYLNTAFTGTSAARLSGSSDFAFVNEDKGVAELLKNFELTNNIPTMTISFEKTAVEAGTRRLAAEWSVELEQDIKNMNGIDVDNEMVNAISYEIQAEIDREMVIRMVQTCLNAGHGKGYTFWEPASADARWSGERNVHFYQKVLVESNRVAIRNRRGAANFIIATPNVCAILEQLPNFAFLPVQGNVNTQPTGVAKVGSIAGRFQVYRDTRTEAQYQYGTRATGVDYALLGYKGPEFFDTGLVYCPYIPVMLQRTVDPRRFTPIVGVMTRYGVVDNLFGSSLYYHLVIVKNLGASFTPGTVSQYMPDLYV